MQSNTRFMSRFRSPFPALFVIAVFCLVCTWPTGGALQAQSEQRALELTISEEPLWLDQGALLKFRVELTNSGAQSEQFDRVRLEVTGPVIHTRNLYSGGTFSLAPGQSVAQTVTLKVPANAPPGHYHIAVIVSLIGGDLASDAFTLRVRDNNVPFTGVYYYPWYQPGWPPEYVRAVLDDPQPPALGEYDSRDQAIISQHIDWSVDFGIDLWVLSWWGENSSTDVTIRDFIRANAAFEDVYYSLFYETTGLLTMTGGQVIFDQANKDKFVADLRYMANTYFDDPNYFRVGTRPVVFIYLTRIFAGDYTGAFQDVRAAMNAMGFDVYLVGDEVYWGSPVISRIDGLDAVTAYNMHGPAQYAGYPDSTGFFSDTAANYDTFRSAAHGVGTAFIPNVMPGFNDRAVRPQADHYAIPRQASKQKNAGTTLKQMTEMALSRVDAEIPIVQVTSWNEWWEDSQVEPTINGYVAGGPPFYTQGFDYCGYGELYLQILLEEIEGAPLAAAFATGWENGQPLGYSNTVIRGHGVCGWASMAVPPECGRRVAEMGVPVEFGTYYLMVTGEDVETTQDSYAYFILSEEDVQITNSTRLVYHVYQHTNHHLCIDFVCRDGTTLRDSGIRDQNGHRLHPALRNDPEGAWLYIEADLASLAGKVIDQIMVGYDDAVAGETGNFRAYVDELYVGN